MMATFEFRSESRSAWRKSLDVALDRVARGKMTEEEFLAAAVPSPDARDPSPADKLPVAIMLREAADREKVERPIREAEERQRAEARQAIIDEFRNVRAWRLAGFYMEDQSTARYTFSEVEDWLRWDAYNLRHNHANVSVILERAGHQNLHCDLSGWFLNSCNDQVRTPSFEALCTRLRDYIAGRRTAKAQAN